MSEKNFISSSKKEYIGDIKINLDNGQSEYLKIYSNSNSEELAYNFCLKHKLDFVVLQKLMEKINFIKNNKISSLSKDQEDFSFNIKSSIKNKEDNEINGINNLIFNENNLTPINFVNNIQLNNLYDTEETKFNCLSPNNFKNGNITNNGKIEEFKEEKINILENKDNLDNNIMSYDLNDSLNDKLNKLEKAYRNYNPENKIKNELKGNTKEVIDLAIQECMNIVEKEEGNCYNILSPEYKNNNVIFDKCNNSASLVIKNNILNSKNIINNYLYSTPKIKQKETFSINSLNNCVNKSKFNKKYEEKDSSKKKSKYKEKNKDINYNLHSKEKEHDLILEKKQDDDILTMQKENYNSNNIEYYNNNIKDFNDSNVNKSNNFKVFNNTSIEHKIDFSLISEKRNYLFLCSNKNIPNNKVENRKTIPKAKNSLSKFNLINKKLARLHKNSNNSFNSQNKKNFLYNNNNFRTITNYSSLNTIPYYENENPVFSTIKTISNCDPRSSTISDKSTTAQNRVTLVSNSNYSNLITRGSTTIKLYKYQTIFNSKKIDKIPKNNKNFNFSNELLFNKQIKEKGKENINSNINYKNTFNKIINKQKNKINLKNINKKIRIRNKKKLIIVNNNIISKNENTSSKIFKSNTTLNAIVNKSKKFQFHPTYLKTKNNTISKNRITSNLIEKNEIINSIKNIFKLITKNNIALDAFSVVNKNVIPSPIYDVVKKIVRNCDNKKRFIEYNDFINKAFILFDTFSNEEKISILNYNKYL